MSGEPSPPSDRFAGTRIPDSPFTGDDGSVAPDVAAALTAYDAGEATYAETLAVLQRARLLVPVVPFETVAAQPPQEPAVAGEGESDMATVLLTGRDGRTALLAFTGTGPLRTWDPETRPVPVGIALAARSAIQDGSEALVIDVAGPIRFVIEGDDLAAVAAGWTLARVGERTAWIRRPAE